MDINVNVEFQFVGNADPEKIKGLFANTPSWSSPASGVLPHVGDWISFPGVNRYTFKVIGREIQYRETEVYLKVVLDVHCEHEEERATLKLVKSDEGDPPA